MENSKLTNAVKAAQNNDVKAFETLYNKYAKSVYFLAMKLLNNSEDAEEVTQDIFLYVYQKIGDLKNPEAFTAWINKVAANKCVDFLRKKNSTANIGIEETVSIDFIEETDRELIPDKSLDNTETTRIIVEIIDKLPLPQRVCVYFYYYEGLTVAEIAKQLAVSENTVKTRLALARDKIRKELENLEDKEGLKLYMGAPLLLFPLLKLAVQHVEVPENLVVKIFAALGLKASIATTAANTVTSEALSATAKTTQKAVSAKTIAAIIAGLVVTGGIITGVVLANLGGEPAPEVIPAINAETQPTEEITEPAAAPTEPEIGTGATKTPEPDPLSAKVGDIISFGGYDWLVLDEQDGRVLIITENVIETRAYNEEKVDITWENCGLREYLNGEFYNAFSTDEKNRIIETALFNNDNPDYDTDGGNDTTDKVFLLSIEEANRYFTGDNSGSAYNTNGELSRWWLRSPGSNSMRAAFIDNNGKVFVDFVRNDVSGRNGVRPALWLML